MATPCHHFISTAPAVGRERSWDVCLARHQPAPEGPRDPRRRHTLECADYSVSLLPTAIVPGLGQHELTAACPGSAHLAHQPEFGRTLLQPLPLPRTG